MNDNAPQLYFDIKRLSETAQRASHDAQEDARRRGLSFVSLRDGRMTRELPTGKRIVIARSITTGRKNSKGDTVHAVHGKRKPKF